MDGGLTDQKVIHKLLKHFRIRRTLKFIREKTADLLRNFGVPLRGNLILKGVHAFFNARMLNALDVSAGLRGQQGHHPIRIHFEIRVGIARRGRRLLNVSIRFWRAALPSRRKSPRAKIVIRIQI